MQDEFKLSCVERFNSKIGPRVVGQCWLWAAKRCRDGYGRFWHNGRTIRATHFALVISGKPRDGNDYALHSCHNPACVNPDHLRWGTQAENMMDKVKVGHSICNVGETNGNAVLTENDVRKIRNDCRGARQLANYYDVSVANIYNVRSGRRWGHVQ